MSGLFGDYNSATMLLVGNWGPLAITLMVLVSIGLLTLTWLDTRALKRPRGAILVVLRSLVLASAVAMLLEPSVELRQVTELPNDVVVLVDQSLSMALPVEEGVTRADRAADAVETLQSWWTEDGQSHRYHLMSFGEDVRALPLPVSDDYEPASSQAYTDILGALEAVQQRFGREETGGVVLISDGVDNRALGGRVRPDEQLDAATIATIERLGVPLHTVSVAGQDQIRDIAVRRVLYDDFAFVRNAVTVQASIHSVGFDTGTVDVILRRSGQVLQTRTIVLSEQTDDYTIDFEFVPELIGKEVYSVEIAPPPEDAVAENNRQFFVLNIIRDRIRVLQVVGRPSWDVRFLRELLKGNPNVDLISFFILRTAEDITRAGNSEMSLIPFPTDELFDEQLPSFDLVIFHNFTFEPYDMRQYLPDVRDYVRGGGGFVMIGGEQSFSLGGYAGTELAEILPVELVPGRDVVTGADTRPFRPSLTEAGGTHPVTRLLFDQLDNERLWRELPMVPGTNLVRGARPDATVLLEHPTAQANGAPLPVLAVADVEQGRSMALTIDGSWRWSFDHVGEGGTSRPFSGFWNAAIRWLIRDPELNLVRVELSDEMVEPGATMEGEVRIFNPDYQPAAGATGTLRITRRSLDTIGAEGESETVEERAFVADAGGRVPVIFVPEESGEYTVHAEVPAASGLLEDDELFLAVNDPAELRQVEPRPSLLQQMADVSGGTFVQLPAGRELTALPLLPPRTADIGQRRLIQLWSSPLALLWFAMLLALEWSLRRAWGRA
jgi:uncharacterized membrane protein